VSVDEPDHFLRSIWLDPTMLKFTPICHARKRIFDSDAWKWTDLKACDCPNVLYYKRNEHFQAGQFLWEDTMNWGNHKDYGGGRSVMLPAVRILFLLGIRRVFLLGCDMTISKSYTYHFEQKRAPGSVSGNNKTYGKLNEWFKELRPLCEAEGFTVLNCNPDSKLEAFDFVPFDEGLESILAEWGNIDVARERSNGLYDEPKPDA